MSSAQRTPRYVDAIRSIDPAASGGSSDVIRLRPESSGGAALAPITKAWPRLIAVPVTRRPWQLLLVPPTPGAPTRSFHVARWQARLAVGVASLLLVVAGAGITALVFAVRTPDLFATSAEAALLRDRLILVEDSLALARAELDAPDELVLGGGDMAAAADGLPRTPARAGTLGARAAARRRAAGMSEEDARGLSSGASDGLPVTGSIASRFSRARRHPVLRVVRPHLGVDVAARRGTQISAPAAGRVSFVGRRFGFGLVVEIQHGNGVVTRYAHCASAIVREGARVARGAPIATVGTSGMSTGPHLHYEVLVNGRQVDPLRYRLPQPADSAGPPAAVPPTSAAPRAPTAPGLAPAVATVPDSVSPR